MGTQVVHIYKCRQNNHKHKTKLKKKKNKIPASPSVWSKYARLAELHYQAQD